jgi:hypothetical protein
VKRAVKPRCKYGCTFIEVTPALFLCEHADYGAASYLKGAVEEARRLVEKAGGFEKIRQRLDAAKEEQRIAAEEARTQALKRQRVRYR